MVLDPAYWRHHKGLPHVYPVYPMLHAPCAALQVKNMGGLGAHCAEDYETLKIFVESPSTYKDTK